VAGDVRFLEQRKARDASAGKLVPERFADGMQVHFLDETLEQGAQGVGVGDGGNVAMVSFDDPLAAGANGAGHADSPLWRTPLACRVDTRVDA